MRFIAAHYLDRHQDNTTEKLRSDERALECASQIQDEGIKAIFSSLHLNIAKDGEDLGRPEKAMKSYHLAFSFIQFLDTDGYGNMIWSGIKAGMERVR
jgi:rifampin ADP-ribosylating transferase